MNRKKNKKIKSKIKKCFTITKKNLKKKNLDNLHFIPNNILTKFF